MGCEENWDYALCLAGSRGWASVRTDTSWPGPLFMTVAANLR